MRIVGIDPGKAGAIAILDDYDDRAGITLLPMPLIQAAKRRAEYDVGELGRILQSAEPLHVFIERLQALPTTMGGGLANFGRGYGLGLLEGVCAGVLLPYTLVTPRRWQADMLDGIPGDDTKQRCALAAGRLFPMMDLRRTPRCRKADEGFVDALLIAVWGQRKLHRGR